MDILAKIRGKDSTLLDGVVISEFCISQTEENRSGPSPLSFALVRCESTGDGVKDVLASTGGEDATLLDEVVISEFCVSQTEDDWSGTSPLAFALV